MGHVYRGLTFLERAERRRRRELYDAKTPRDAIEVAGLALRPGPYLRYATISDVREVLGPFAEGQVVVAIAELVEHELAEFVGREVANGT